MKKLKVPALFALAVAPIAAVAGYFTILYQLEFMGEAMIAEAVDQLGSLDVLILVYVVQTVVYGLVCGFFGTILAQKLGVFRAIRFQWPELKQTLVLSLAGGILFSLDYWTFGAWIPGVREATELTLSPVVVAASVLYGGVMEELMMRLMLMSLLAWIIWKLFYRKHQQTPQAALIWANAAAALLFAAGHLPATVMTFGTLTPMILLRCFLLNGGFGLLFGWLYRKYGIQYSMVSHATLHIVSKAIWLVFI